MWGIVPPRCGVRPHHTSAPRRIEQLAEFCAAMTKRCALGIAAADIRSVKATARL